MEKCTVCGSHRTELENRGLLRHFYYCWNHEGNFIKRTILGQFSRVGVFLISPLIALLDLMKPSGGGV